MGAEVTSPKLPKSKVTTDLQYSQRRYKVGEGAETLNHNVIYSKTSHKQLKVIFFINIGVLYL